MEDNCDEDLPRWLCVLGNLAGYGSSAIWVVVLFPQLFYNYKRKSVQGLSPAYALANFFASLCNVLFVFSLDLPPFVYFMGVYMPLINFLLLIQFWWYDWFLPYTRRDNTTSRSDNNISDDSNIEDYQQLSTEGSDTPNSRTDNTPPEWWVMVAVVVVFFGLVGVILGIQLAFVSTKPIFAWVSIVIWSTELLPQLYLNMKLRSTIGQAPLSLYLTWVGKTCDATSAMALTFPLQSVVMTFWSTSTAYFNIAQMLLYSSSLSLFFAIPFFAFFSRSSFPIGDEIDPEDEEREKNAEEGDQEKKEEEKGKVTKTVKILASLIGLIVLVALEGLLLLGLFRKAPLWLGLLMPSLLLSILIFLYFIRGKFSYFVICIYNKIRIC